MGNNIGADLPRRRAVDAADFDSQMIRWSNHADRILPSVRFRAKREQLERFEGLSPESQGQNLSLTVSYVPCSLAVLSP